jgi:hypothetical protein
MSLRDINDADAATSCVAWLMSRAGLFSTWTPRRRDSATTSHCLASVIRRSLIPQAQGKIQFGQDSIARAQITTADADSQSARVHHHNQRANASSRVPCSTEYDFLIASSQDSPRNVTSQELTCHHSIRDSAIALKHRPEYPNRASNLHPTCIHRSERFCRVACRSNTKHIAMRRASSRRLSEIDFARKVSGEADNTPHEYTHRSRDPLALHIADHDTTCITIAPAKQASTGVTLQHTSNHPDQGQLRNQPCLLSYI